MIITTLIDLYFVRSVSHIYSSYSTSTYVKRARSVRILHASPSTRTTSRPSYGTFLIIKSRQGNACDLVSRLRDLGCGKDAGAGSCAYGEGGGV